MVKKIGPTFPDELKAAGVLGAAFAWGEDGAFTFDPSMSEKDIETVQVVYAAHDPSKTLE